VSPNGAEHCHGDAKCPTSRRFDHSTYRDKGCCHGRGKMRLLIGQSNAFFELLQDLPLAADNAQRKVTGDD
jgi:hypothetical protein